MLESEFNRPPIHFVPLGTFIDVVGANVKQLSRLRGSIIRLVSSELKSRPFLNKYIQSQMERVSTSEEAKLIGETTLTVLRVVRATSVPIYEGSPELEEEEVVSTADDVLSLGRQRGGLNDIYNSLELFMETRPAVAAFVAQKMNTSESLEEANLVGASALVAYRTEDYFSCWRPAKQVLTKASEYDQVQSKESLDLSSLPYDVDATDPECSTLLEFIARTGLREGIINPLLRKICQDALTVGVYRSQDNAPLVTIRRLYELDEKKLKHIEGLGPKHAHIIYETLQDILKTGVFHLTDNLKIAENLLEIRTKFIGGRNFFIRESLGNK